MFWQNAFSHNLFGRNHSRTGYLCGCLSVLLLLACITSPSVNAHHFSIEDFFSSSPIEEAEEEFKQLNFGCSACKEAFSLLQKFLPRKGKEDIDAAAHALCSKINEVAHYDCTNLLETLANTAINDIEKLKPRSFCTAIDLCK